MNCDLERAFNSKRGNISEEIQKQAKKISSPVISDFLIVARRGFTRQVLQGLKEGGSGKASSTDKNGRNCLQLAAIHGHFETVHGILQTGLVDIDAVNKRGLTALHDSCSEGHIKISFLLLSVGASVASQTKDGWTCLMSACSNGHLKLAQIMVAAGPDLNTQTKLGLTALHIAAWKGHVDVVEMLLHEGCNPMTVSHSGKTALQLAKEENQHQCVSVLTAATAKGSGDPIYRISSLEGQLRHCQTKLTESVRKFEAELARQQITSTKALESLQKEHETDMALVQQKIKELEILKGKEIDTQVKSSPPSPPPLQPKSPSKRRRLKKNGDLSTSSISKPDIILTGDIITAQNDLTSPPVSQKDSNSDTNLLSFKDMPKSSSYGDLTAIGSKIEKDLKLPNTSQVSPAMSKRSTEKKSGRRESGERLTISALVDESLSNPSSISSIRKELKSDSFTPKMKRKFPNRSPGTLPSMSPKMSHKDLEPPGAGGDSEGGKTL